MRELEKAQIKFQSKYPTVGRDGIAPLTGAPSSSSITAAPMGFQSKDQVMQVFEYLMAHQADKQDQAEVARVAAASARATRKSASTGFKNKRNSTGTRAASEASSKSNQKEGRSNSRSSTDQANASATSYGLVGTFIALFTGGILLWGSANKEHGYRSSSGNNSKSRGEKTAAHINRISKHSMVPNKNEDTKENDDNFLWNVLVILIGEKNTMMIPKGLEKLCARGSNICRLLHLKTMANFHNMLFVATILLQWIRKLMNRACQEIESRRQNSAAQSNFQTGTLPSWTTYVSASPTNKKKIRDDNSREAPTRSLAKKETLNSSKSLTKNKNMSTDIVNKNKISKKKTRTQVTSKSVDYTATVITSLHDEVVVSQSEIISAHVTVKDNETNDLYSDEVLDDFIQQKDDDISISSLERPRISTSSPTLSLMTTTTTPSSPSSVAAIDEVQSVILSDAQVFDDSYWRNIDNEAEDEGAWIETVTLPSKGKLRKTQNDERLTQTIQPLSKQRQEVFRQQLVRKSAEAAFSSTSMSGRDRHSNLALQQAKRGTPTLRKKSPTHTTPTTSSSSPSSSSSVLTTSSVVAIPSYSSKEISLTATATLKTMSGKSNSTRSHQPLVPEHLILAVEFPPLPIYGSVQSASSSAENSTDAEDQSSISGDSHLSSPRSRSFSCGHDTVNTSDEQMVDPIIHQPLQQGLMGHHMQMPYYPLGFMPMTMQHTVYDPSMNLSFSPPTGILSSEQQQGLLHHQQGIMMMPYPSIYMLPHPQFDPQFGHMQHQQQHSQIHGNHIMNTTEQQIEYNTHMNQMYHESQVIPSNMSLSIPIVEEPILDSNDIVEIVRQQM